MTSIVSILEKNNLATLATICADGAPWVTPVHFVFDEKNIYWMSPTIAQHSKNIKHDARVAISVVSQNGPISAAYIASKAQLVKTTPRLQRLYEARFPGMIHKTASFYRASIGSLDSEKSRPGFLYFKEEAV